MQIPLTLVQLTPPGRGAVATLRIEGPGALQAIRWLFHKSSRLSLGCDAPHRMAFGHFGGPSGEEVVVRVLSNASVDLHCHGGHAAVERIRNLLSGLQEATVPATTQANLQETCPSQPGDSPFLRPAAAARSLGRHGLASNLPTPLSPQPGSRWQKCGHSAVPPFSWISTKVPFGRPWKKSSGPSSRAVWREPRDRSKNFFREPYLDGV